MTSERVVQGNLRVVMVALALPVLAEQMLNTFVALFDTYLAGQIAGRAVHATAAVGLAAYVGWLMSMLFMFVGTGATALVARCVGEGDKAEANRLANQSFTLAVFMGIGSFFLIYVLAPWFARWQLMTPAAYPIVLRYLRIDACGHPATALTLVAAAALRGTGDMKTPMYVLAAVNMLNVIVSASLVFGLGPIPALGVDGIVIGTLAGRVFGGILMLIVLLCGRSGLKLRSAWLVPAVARARRIFQIGAPAALDGAILWTGSFIFLRIVAGLAEGEAAMVFYAAHIVVIRLQSLTYLPASAWAAASATMIGQALGAGKIARARRVGHEGALQCGLLSFTLGIGFFLLAGPICRIMNTDAQVVAAAMPVLRMAGFFQVFLALSIVYVGALRGAGDTRYPLLFTILTLLLVRLPLGYFLGVTLGGGLFGAWIGVCADTVVRAALPAVRYLRGKWVTTQV